MYMMIMIKVVNEIRCFAAALLMYGVALLVGYREWRYI